MPSWIPPLVNDGDGVYETPRAACAALGRFVRRRFLDLRGRRRGDLAAVALDELLDELCGVVVLDLPRRRLHQVGARALERPGNAVVQCELREPDGVDHDAGRVRRVPDLELELDVQRHVAEARALEPDVCPLAVG